MRPFRWTKNENELIEVDELDQEEVQRMANQKLAELEDLEGELGIGFRLLSNILKEGIYYEYNKDQYMYIRGGLLILDIKNKCFYCNYTEDDRLVFYFKDYRGSWALTKDELILPF